MEVSSTILVVGGAGYVGCHIVLQLLENGFKVVIADNGEICQCKKPDIIQKIEQLTGQQVAFYNCNIRNEETLNSIFDKENIACVIHLATAKNSTKQPLELYRNDVCGSLRLLQVMQKHNVKKIVFSSTVYVYGKPEFLPVEEDHEAGYKLPNVLSKTKIMIEEAFKDLCKSDGTWTAVVLRHADPDGVRQGFMGNKWVAGQVTSIAKQIVLGQGKLTICRDEYDSLHEEGMRDYIHVCDVAAAFVLAAKKILFSHDLEGFRVFNLGSPRPYSTVDVIERISDLSGNPVVYEVSEKGKPEPGLYVSAKLVENELGWKAEKNLDDICEDALSLATVMVNLQNMAALPVASYSCCARSE